MLRWLAVAIAFGRIFEVATFEDLKIVLLEWLQQARAANLPISALILKENSEEIAGRLAIEEFSAS